MAARVEPRTNRNGAVGEFSRYAPRRLSTEEIVQGLRDRRAGVAAEEDPPVRTSTTLWQEDGYRLVRYFVGSPELKADVKAVAPRLGREAEWYAGDRSNYTAVFGVIGPDETARALFDVIDDDRRGPGIFTAYRAEGAELPNEVALRFLEHLDVPATWSAGGDTTVRDLFDAVYDRTTGDWKAVEPVQVVVVSFERVCFSIRPAMREQVDVMVAPDPSQDLASPDKEHVYWARDFYRGLGMERLQGMGLGVRPGFSSWLHKGDPVLAKIVGNGLDEELAATFPEKTATPGGPRR